MIAVRILRWVFGYVRIEVGGRFPERFLNIAAHKGINLWGLGSSGETHTAFGRRTETGLMEEAAKKAGCSLVILRQYGLPHLLAAYRCRAGLLAGLAAAVIFCQIMSGHIWNITIDAPDVINEYEIRELLRENGVTVGAKASDINVPAVINRISSSDKRISWMTLNLLGTTAETAFSPNLSEGLVRRETHDACNIISGADGVVTRIHAYNGSARVQVGDGIHKNQLLVSGVMVYNNGDHVLADSDARIYAKTSRRVSIAIPAESEPLRKTDSETIKREIALFGIRLPLTLNGDPQGMAAKSVSREQVTWYDAALPLHITEEHWQSYENEPVKLTLTQAQEILMKKLQLYEWFMLADTRDGTILSRKQTVTQAGSTYRLDADYEIEEDIAVVSVIEVHPEDPSEEAPAS